MSGTSMYSSVDNLCYNFNWFLPKRTINFIFRILTDDNIDYNDNITLESALKDSSRFYSRSSFRGTNFNAVKMGK